MTHDRHTDESPATPADDRWHGRAIAHVDLDAFFAAVEQLDHPEWRGKPVIVGGNASRGVVSTCSYEARVFGVRSAMPSVRAATLCPDAIWAPPRFERYKELSDAVFAILRDESPSVQPVSVDEAYLDVTPGEFSAEDPVAILERVRARIAELGITASAGLSTSRSVSKIASDFDKPDGLTVVRPGDEAAFLAPLPVRAMPGIGPKAADRLAAAGVHTLGQLAAVDEVTARHLMGSFGPGLVVRAQGRDERGVTVRDPVKSVSAERTFGADIRDIDEVSAALASLGERVGRRLRRKGLSGHTVTVKVRYSDFTTRTAQRTLPRASDDETEFHAIALELLRGLWSPGVGVRLLGLGLSGFGERAQQLDLLAAPPAGDSEPSASVRPGLVRGIDAVRARFGDAAVRYGKDLTAPRQPAEALDTEEDPE